MILFQRVIRREDLRRNPQVLYVFGDNVERKGMGGLAAECRGEQNAAGVATKFTAHEFYRNDPIDVAVQNRIIDGDMKSLFNLLKLGGIVVWPAAGIGRGLARLPEFAPLTFDHIESKLGALIKVSRLFEAGKIEEATYLATEHISGQVNL